MNILFHYPGSFHENLDTAEKKRPKKMAEAFQLEGHTITLLTGTYNERVAKIKDINPQEFDLLYSENSNIPLQLATQNRIPRFNNPEVNFLKNLKIPKGVYYRDIYWIQKEYLKNLGMIKGTLGKIYYQKEIEFYKNHFDKVFVQTHSFASQIPQALRPTQIDYLPPAGDLTPNQNKEINGTTKLIYVGSCLPPVYDLQPLLDKLNSISNIEVTIITRPKDKEFLLKSFKPNNHISILEAFGKNVEDLLSNHHIGLMCPENTLYLDMILPFKFYEYISFDCPLIGKGHNEITRKINENNLGVSINSYEELETAILNIKNKYADYLNSCRTFKTQNTWQARVKHAIQSLTQSNL